MAGKVSTRERILNIALDLFNEEGEAQISTVDIAGEVGISPGNLYYHYKGKEAIIEALFASFETELQMILSAPIKRPLAIEDNWIYVYIVAEEIYDFRFFYYSFESILERCPSLRPRLMRLINLKRETARAMLTGLEEKRVLVISPQEKTALVDRIAQHLTFWLQYRHLLSPGYKPRELISDCVHSVMMQIAPFIRGDQEAYVALLSDQFALVK